MRSEFNFFNGGRRVVSLSGLAHFVTYSDSPRAHKSGHRPAAKALERR
jgi:hypothetical protein